MGQKPAKGAKPVNATPFKNPLETVGEFGATSARETLKSTADIGRGVFEEMLGIHGSESNEQEHLMAENKEVFQPSKVDLAKEQVRSHLEKKPTELFNYVDHRERVTNQQEIRELTAYLREELKRSVEVLKAENAQFADEVRDAEKIAMQELPENPTLYDLSFIEVLVQLMQTLIMEVRESRTWLSAFSGKKNKRGSLFAKRSKEKGSAYSMSQELQITRSTQ